MSNLKAARQTLNHHNRAFPFQTPKTMFNLSNIPSTSSVLSTYTTFTAAAMLLRSVVTEAQNLTQQIIPQKLQEKLLSKVGKLIGDDHMTLVIDEYNGLTLNQVFEASETFLKTKISPTTTRLKVSKSPREKDFTITINKEEKIIDIFDGIKLNWQMIINETQKTSTDCEGYYSSEKVEKRSIELTFHKIYKEKVVSSYLPYVLERFKAIKEENKVVKLYSLGNFYGEYDGGPWSSVNLDHPSTFDTLAMDPTVKKELIDDLDRFVKRRKFYKRVGKAWKRGYLLYGPPGTGKSSLIAAMANYLKFHIYDLELTSLQSNSELKRLLVSTSNRSILVIEDIDCSLEFENREVGGGGYNKDSQMTLSGLLNFIDGLWSSCSDERIIIFTTNHKERLDPALLRPGRMDMHIHMSYCTIHGFKILASNYLGLDHHPMFGEIEQLITEVQVTPAEIAEELMKSEEAEVALQGLIKFLQMKKMENSMASIEGKSELNEEGECLEEKVEDDSKMRKNKKKAKRGCRRSRRFKNI